MPNVTTNLRVFLSSPGDLSDERGTFKNIIDESNNILSDSDSDIRLELIMWETDTYPSIGKDAQSIINEQIGDNYDIFVGLMWTRFGTPTPRAGSGTEEEFNLALEKLTRNPANTRILFYFKDSPPESLSKIDLKQLEKVNSFKEQLQLKGLLGSYKSLEQFIELSRNHLLKHARDFRKGWGFNNSQENLTTFKSTISVEDEIEETDGFIRTAQTEHIKVFPSKKVYARLNVEEDDWRKEFTVRYPIIEGLKSESIAYKINSIFNYEKVFDISIEDFIESDTWLEDLDYSIKFLKKPFLNIEFTMAGTAAYPTFSSQNIVVNYETGERIFAKDIFEERSLERLVSVINEFIEVDLRKSSIQEKYIDEIPLELEVELNEYDEDISTESRFYSNKFTVENLDDFSLEEYGITFNFNFGFIHAIKALEPEGKYYFDFSSLKQFIKKGSVLEKFIKEIWKR